MSTDCPKCGGTTEPEAIGANRRYDDDTDAPPRPKRPVAYCVDCNLVVITDLPNHHRIAAGEARFRRDIDG